MDEPITIIIDRELEEIVPGYLENRRKDVTNIRQSLEKGDMEAIRTLGHRMKGSGAGYGFAMITEIGRAMEIAAKEDNVEKILQGVNELESYIQRVRVTYQD